MAVFGLADAVFFEKLPVPQPDRLVVLRWVAGGATPFEWLDGWSSGNDRESTSTSFSYNAFVAARDATRGRADVFGFADLYQIHLGWGSEPPQVATGQVVSGNYFSGLGLRPASGRFITPDDDRADAEPVAVVSDAFWRSRLGARRDVTGQVVRINRIATTIVGVAPRGSTAPGRSATRPTSRSRSRSAIDSSVPWTISRGRPIRAPGGSSSWRGCRPTRARPPSSQPSSSP